MTLPKPPSFPREIGHRISSAGILAPSERRLEAMGEECLAIVAEMTAPLVAEVERLRVSVVAFAGPHAQKWALDHGLPEGHLHPIHYDILANAGARMDGFLRHEIVAAREDDDG